MRMHFANKRLTICARMNLLIQMLASLAVLLQKALRVIAVVGRYNLLVASLKSLAFVAVIACIYPHLAGNRTSDWQLSLPIHPLYCPTSFFPAPPTYHESEGRVALQHHMRSQNCRFVATQSELWYLAHRAVRTRCYARPEICKGGHVVNHQNVTPEIRSK